MLITPEWVKSIAISNKPKNLYEIGYYQERPVYLDLEDPTNPRLSFFMGEETILCYIRTKLSLRQMCEKLEITVPKLEPVIPDWIPGYQVADNQFTIGKLNYHFVFLRLENGGIFLSYYLNGKYFYEEVKTKEELDLKCSLLGIKI